MIDSVFEKPFVVVAHRGGGEEAAENTVKGIRHGLRVGADVIEIDLRATKDGHIILLHDADFDRVAGIEEEPGNLELGYIKENILIFDKEPVAILEEALEVVNAQAILFLEIKEKGIVSKVLDIVKKFEAQEWIVIISFLESVIQEAKQIDSSVKTGLVYNRPPGKIKEAKELGADFVLPRYNLATYKAIAFAHSLGLKVVSWTVNEKEIVAELLHDGSDSIATDYPQKFVRFKKELLKNEPVSINQERLKLQFRDGLFDYHLLIGEESLSEVDRDDELYKAVRKKCSKVKLFTNGNKYYLEGRVSERELKYLFE